MGRVCTVCAHPKRREIDRAVVGGVPNTRIAAKYGVCEQAVRWHKSRHLTAQMLRAKEKMVLRDADSLVAEMNRLHAYAAQVIDRAVTLDDDRMVLAGVAEARRNVEVLAKLGPLGEMEQRLRALEDATPRVASPRVREPHSGDDDDDQLA